MERIVSRGQAAARTQARGGVQTNDIYLAAKTRVNLLREQKLLDGITALGKTWDCSRYSTGGIAAKYERLKRQSIGTMETITGATKTNPVVVTVPGHTFLNNDNVSHYGVAGMTELNGIFTVGNSTANTYALVGIDGTTWGAYTSGGTATEMCEWVAVDNAIVELIAADFLWLSDAMNNYIDLVIKQARAHKNAILLLTTQNAVDAYDFTVNWPPNVY